MNLLRHLFFLGVFGALAVWIGRDIARDLRSGTVTLAFAPWEYTPLSRAQKPFNYWGVIIFKLIGFMGMAIISVAGLYFLL